MKCSSRRNCDRACGGQESLTTGLNEVQFPKELRPVVRVLPSRALAASMKCSSRRNCDRSASTTKSSRSGLNEVQFPKELRPRIADGQTRLAQPQ